MVGNKNQAGQSPFILSGSTTQILKAIFRWILIAILVPTLAFGQTLISGDIDGIVTDPSGAVIANATVLATEIDTGTVTTTKTTRDGVYHLPLLKPGRYTVSVSSAGFNTATVNVPVGLGKVARANVKMKVGSTAQTVHVTEAAPLLDTENGEITTTFDKSQVEDLPNPGNDVSYVQQLAPGSVINTTGGSGTMSSFGLPADANNLTINGVSQIGITNDTLNIFSSNMLLGNNELSEATVVSNAYSAQYGALSGAQVTELTRSGSNQFHGNAAFWYNDRNLDANNYFANQQGTPRASESAKQWAAAVGGPILRDKVFFFVNTEGVVFAAPPSSQLVYVPSQSFQTIVSNQVAQKNPAELDLYKQIFSLYNRSPVPAGQTLRPYQNVNPITGAVSPNPDVNSFTSLLVTDVSEKLVSGRVDYSLSSTDTAYVYVKHDWGTQPGYIDPINSNFSEYSSQPTWIADLVETHTFSPSATNQFLASINHYTIPYDPNPNASATFPYQFNFQDTTVVQNGNVLHYADPLTSLNPAAEAWPQGLASTQYQFTDNFSITKGAHTLTAGFTFIRPDISLYGGSGVVPDLTTLGAGYSQPYEQARGTGTYFNTFADGYASSTYDSFPVVSEDPIALYQLGAYLQDQWQVRPNLTLNAGVRFERNSNPVCAVNCIVNFSGNFFDVNQTANTPYNSVIDTHQHNLFKNYQLFIIEPRASFAWQPLGASSKVVVKGGFGIFADPFTLQPLYSLFSNIPNHPGFTANSGSLTASNSPQYLLDPPLTGSGYQAVVASNAAFVNGFNTGGTYNSISQEVAASGSSLSLPGFTNVNKNINYPTYDEWNLQIQQQIGNYTTISYGYNGNRGYNEPVNNNSVDAWWNPSLLPIPGHITNTQTGNVFAFQPQGFPTSPHNQQFSSFSEESTGAVSNYNGFTVDVIHRRSWLTLDANYTWGHALDEISNEGIVTFSPSAIGPESPYNLRYNYGNADYDVRNNFKFSYVLNIPQFHGYKKLTGGWQFTQALFWRAGFPFTVTDGFASQAFGSMGLAPGAPYPYNAYGGQVPAVPLNRNMNHHCGNVGIFNFQTLSGGNCFGGIAAFTDPSGFGADDRNQYTGPGYFDTDIDILKTIHVPRTSSAIFQFGVQMFNALNHPNFANPNSDISTGSSFGQITANTSPTNSIYGAYFGANTSPRLIQLKGTFKF